VQLWRRSLYITEIIVRGLYHMVRRVRAQYRYDINYTNGAPQMIRFTCTRPGTSIVNGARQLGTDIKRRVGEAVSRFTGWSVRRSKERVQGVLSATGGRGGFSSGSDVGYLYDIDGDLLTGILATIQQDGSNPDMDFWEIVWDYWIIPNTIVGGASQHIKKPKWHPMVAYSQTWKGYEDEEGVISCAAFSICWGLYSSEKGKHYERIQNAIRDSRELMEELGWGVYVTIQELKILFFEELH